MPVMEVVNQVISLATKVKQMHDQAMANEDYARSSLGPDVDRIRCILVAVKSRGQAPEYISDNVKNGDKMEEFASLNVWMQSLSKALKEAEALIKKVAESTPQAPQRKRDVIINFAMKLYSAIDTKKDLEACAQKIAKEKTALIDALNADVWVHVTTQPTEGDASKSNASLPQALQLVNMASIDISKDKWTSLDIGAPVTLAAGLTRTDGPLRLGRVGIVVDIDNERYKVVAKYERSITGWFAKEELLLLEQNPLPPFVNEFDVVVAAEEYNDVSAVKDGPLGTTPEYAGIVVTSHGLLADGLQVLVIASRMRAVYYPGYLKVLQGEERNSVIKNAAKASAGCSRGVGPGDIVMLDRDNTEFVYGEALAGPLSEPYSIGIVESMTLQERAMKKLSGVDGILKVRGAKNREHLYDEEHLKVVYSGAVKQSSIPMLLQKPDDLD